MKAIDGALDITKKYNIVDIVVLDEYDFRFCENCGKILKNVAIVEDEDNKIYEIGLDCAEVLSNISNNFSIDILKVKEAKKVLARRKKFLKELKEAGSIIVDENENLFWFYKSLQTEWQAFYRGVGKYTSYKSIIDKLNKPVTFVNFQ